MAVRSPEIKPKVGQVKGHRKAALSYFSGKEDKFRDTVNMQLQSTSKEAS